MQTKCTICNREEEVPLSKLEEISKFAKELKPEYYLNILNITSGKCLNTDEHSFMFTEDFIKEVSEIITKHKNNVTESNSLLDINTKLKKELDELLIRITENEAKHKANEDRLQNIYNDSGNCIKLVTRLTGSSDIKKWYSLLEE